jgi:hypothetical protein
MPLSKEYGIVVRVTGNWSALRIRHSPGKLSHGPHAFFHVRLFQRG